MSLASMCGDVGDEYTLATKCEAACLPNLADFTYLRGSVQAPYLTRISVQNLPILLERTDSDKLWGEQPTCTIS